jgi:hypothetical protein
MALDPGIRDLLQAIEEALAQQPAADDRAPLNELTSRADLVRQAVKRAWKMNRRRRRPPGCGCTPAYPPGSGAEPNAAFLKSGVGGWLS